MQLSSKNWSFYLYAFSNLVFQFSAVVSFFLALMKMILTDFCFWIPQVLNKPQQAGRFNFITQFPYYREVFYKPDLGNKKLGKPVVFDMDMSAGDFLALFYLLKVPVEVINLKVKSLFKFPNFFLLGFL